MRNGWVSGVAAHFEFTVFSSGYHPQPWSGPSSVMELLKPEDRERLLSLRNASNPPSVRTSTSTTDSLQTSQSAGPSAELLPKGAAASSGHHQQQEALAAWRGVQTSSQTFRPFEKNPSKQARYELYLSRLRQGHKGRRFCPESLSMSVATVRHEQQRCCFKAKMCLRFCTCYVSVSNYTTLKTLTQWKNSSPSPSDALEQSLDPGMTEWERSREREEFVRASILYRPSSSSLSSRFTRGKHQEDEDTVEVSQDQEVGGHAVK